MLKETSKTIVFVNRSFWPDIEATGQLLTELCAHLAERYTVIVVAGRSYYRAGVPFGLLGLQQEESHQGVRIRRVRNTRLWKGNLLGRLINWVTYSFFAFFSLCAVRADIVVVGTDPPFLGLLALALKKIRGTRFIYLCNDLYPDVAVALGELSPKNIIGRFFDYLNGKAFRQAECVVCLGESMQARLEKKNIPSPRIRIIPTWIDTRSVVPVEPKDNPLIAQWGLAGKFVIAYSGNIGLSQNFNVVLEAVRRVDPELPFIFLFIGQGAGRDGLVRRVSTMGLRNVKILPYQPIETISFSLSAADLHLILLRPGMAGAIVPSKLYGILAAGRPYLAVTDDTSEPAILARQHHCGFWAAPDDVDAIRDMFLRAFSQRDELLRMGRRARLLAEARFDRHRVLGQWSSLLDSVF